MENVSDLKKLHDYHATIVHLLTTRVQFYYEEFQGVQELVKFYSGVAQEIKQKIESLEKPMEKQNEETTTEQPK